MFINKISKCSSHIKYKIQELYVSEKVIINANQYNNNYCTSSQYKSCLCKVWGALNINDLTYVRISYIEADTNRPIKKLDKPF